MSLKSLKLINIITIRKLMILKSGVKIGGSNEELNIGGVDNPIVRNPITKEPYIPGSTLKGVLRSILEIVKGVSDEKGGICTCGKCLVCKLFGVHPNDNNENKTYREPSRLIFRDAELTDKSRVILRKLNPSMVEIKKENTINRITSEAKPRTFERIPSGVEFNIEIQLKVFEGDNKEDLQNYINIAFELLKHNYIGSSGSRGYGKVEFKDCEEQECLDIIKELTEVENKYFKEQQKQ
ncbi:type III-A CRISPR-associated RAMP protein Csm3 [Clostridium cochlearium]|uniref:type III-A CRISPR-associated RAMP protein Csm3 n=1 Tax=Clostridium cochlearium TaxID=1494 RepID=UPI000B94D4E8|nr:type III-A CRISPR-associated RAMP protein Csm3 [Clostridium cochlearium]MBV1821310.1 type III-A CRISPR-associated RAMP protein Csm3 [Bacteroidales bacterium MSK.15.36]SNV76791.1 CRISPR-associated Csm3 family protein [Clostridium cochlearium]STA92601.1 CRISPR-associated Csm3 family protein [Clostridium cochlearium]